MANKPVKVLTDLLTRKQIIKQDLAGNTLFLISGTIGNGYVSSSFPITASYFVGDGRYLTNVSGSGGINSVYTSGSISGSGLQANPVFLKDPLVIGTITSSYIYSPQITGTLYGTASYAISAGGIDVTSIQNAYKRLRYQQVGFFDATGSATIELPTSSYGGVSFTTSSINYINVSVQIKEDGVWLNDLLSIQLFTSSNKVFIELSAPALNNANEYKLLALNEDPDYFII
jgi:hypothetical protein